MDELQKALMEMQNVINYYITEIASHIEDLKQLKTSTIQNFGNDTLGEKTASKLDAVIVRLSGSLDEVAGLRNKVDAKLAQIEVDKKILD